MQPVADRLAVRLHELEHGRFEGVEDGAPYVAEQHLYCRLVGDKIEHADLICSGFRPR